MLISGFHFLFFREAESIQLDGLSVKEMQDLRDKAEKHTFQAEVDRMMKLIINSLYKNKEVRFKSISANKLVKSFFMHVGAICIGTL